MCRCHNDLCSKQGILQCFDFNTDTDGTRATEKIMK